MTKNKTNHRSNQKVLLWTTVLAVCATVISSFVTTTVGAISSGLGAYNNAGNAAQTQAVVNAFKKCVNAAKGTRGDTNSVFVRVEGNNFGSMFDSAKNTNIATGAWLENQIQGKFQDGEIYCKQGDAKIAEMFADALGLDLYTDIICNGASAGIMKPQYKTDSGWTDANISSGVSSCTNELERMQRGEDVSFVWNFTDGAAEELVEQLYNNYVAQNPDANLPTWDNVNDFSDPVVSYYSLYTDFMDFCTDGATYEFNSNDDNYWPEVSVVDSETGTITKVRYRKSNKKGTPTSVTTNTTGCDQYVENLNANAETTAAIINKAEQAGYEDIKRDCNKKAASSVAALQNKINGILNSSSSPQELKGAASKKQEELNALKGNYWTETRDAQYNINGVKCVEISSDISADFTSGPTQRPSDLDPDAANSPNSGDSSSGEAGVTDGCFGEAGVLGWILCPVLRYVGQAANSIYEDIESTYLQVNPDIVERASSGWTIFRNFANAIFAVMFIIVILSQITGFGISNYGIKKILPRLIVVVVLVNVSFFLCEAAIDLSNILGYSFNQFFRKLGTDGGSAAVTMQSTTALILDIINGIGVAGGIAGVAFTIVEGGWLPFLVPLLIVAITILIGIFFFFVVLAVRQVGIVILAVLSPIAIILYALPNTQKLFSKWLKMFADLLIVYPICGLLMGGSEYASRLLLSGDQEVSPMYYFVVLLLSVVPFFFIPTILRGAINGIAGLGTKLQGMGQRLGRTAGMRAGGGIMRSNWARTNMEEHQRNANERYHTRRVKNLERTLNSGRGSEKSNARLQRRLTRSNAILAKYHDEDMRSEAMGTEAYIPGSDRYELAAGKFERAQDKLDVAAQEDVYRNGVNNNADINALGADESYVDVNNEDSLIREHAIQMRRLQSEIASGADHTKTLTKVKALQNMLSETDSGRSAIQNNMLKMANEQITNNTMAETGEESALSLATAHLKDAHMGTYKQNNRGMSKMIQDFAGKNYSNIRTAGDIKSVATGTTDSFGQAKNEYRSQYYGKAGLTGYTTESLANADDGALDRIMNGIENNEFTDADIQTISSLANDALTANAKGTLPIKEENRQRLQKLAQGAYTAGSVAVGQTDTNGNVITSTAGSQAIGNASMASLEFINSGLQSGAISGDTATRIAENARAALQDPAIIHDPERSEMLNQILTTANSMGVNQLEQIAAFDPNKYKYQVSAGNTIQAVDSSSIKVRGAAKPPKLEMQAMPNGWTLRNPDPNNINGKMVWQKQVSPGAWVNLNSDELKTVNAINRTNRDRQRQNAINGYDVEVPTPPPAP